MAKFEDLLGEWQALVYSSKKHATLEDVYDAVSLAEKLQNLDQDKADSYGVYGDTRTFITAFLTNHGYRGPFDNVWNSLLKLFPPSMIEKKRGIAPTAAATTKAKGAAAAEAWARDSLTMKRNHTFRNVKTGEAGKLIGTRVEEAIAGKVWIVHYKIQMRNGGVIEVPNRWYAENGTFSIAPHDYEYSGGVSGLRGIEHLDPPLGWQTFSLEALADMARRKCPDVRAEDHVAYSISRVQTDSHWLIAATTEKFRVCSANDRFKRMDSTAWIVDAEVTHLMQGTIYWHYETRVATKEQAVALCEKIRRYFEKRTLTELLRDPTHGALKMAKPKLDGLRGLSGRRSLTYGQLPDYNEYSEAFDRECPRGRYSIELTGNDERRLEGLVESGNYNKRELLKILYTLTQRWRYSDDDEAGDFCSNILETLGFEWV